jgi:hypothetical protein
MLPLDTDPISPDEILALAASVYAGLSEPDIQAVEQIAADRRNFLSDRSSPPPKTTHPKNELN